MKKNKNFKLKNWIINLENVLNIPARLLFHFIYFDQFAVVTSFCQHSSHSALLSSTLLQESWLRQKGRYA